MSWTPDEISDLIAAHSAHLGLYARQWGTSESDVVQEALVELITAPARPRDPVAWLYTVVRRRAMNAARSEVRRRRHEEAAAVQRSRWFQKENQPQIEADDVERALRQLAPEDREIIVLRIWSDLTFEQTAHVLNTSVSSAHRRYNAALEHLKKELGESCPNPRILR